MSLLIKFLFTNYRLDFQKEKESKKLSNYFYIRVTCSCQSISKRILDSKQVHNKKNKTSGDISGDDLSEIKLVKFHSITLLFR